MKRKLKLEIYHGELIVFSQWTGEVCYPWEFRKVLGMIRDFRLPDIEGF